VQKRDCTVQRNKSVCDSDSAGCGKLADYIRLQCDINSKHY